MSCKRRKFCCPNRSTRLIVTRCMRRALTDFSVRACSLAPTAGSKSCCKRCGSCAATERSARGREALLACTQWQNRRYPMNCFNSTFAIALLCVGFSAGALAQDKSRTPDNAQATNKSTTSAKAPKMQHQTQLGKSDVRDWKAIDKNHDNLIEPEEME